MWRGDWGFTAVEVETTLFWGFLINAPFMDIDLSWGFLFGVWWRWVIIWWDTVVDKSYWLWTVGLDHHRPDLREINGPGLFWYIGFCIKILAWSHSVYFLLDWSNMAWVLKRKIYTELVKLIYWQILQINMWNEIIFLLKKKDFCFEFLSFFSDDSSLNQSN